MAIDHSRAEAGSLAGEALDADEAEFYRDLAAERCTDPGAGWAWDYIGAALAGRSQVEADFADGKNPYARSNPDAPWVERQLPLQASAWLATGRCAAVGHEPIRHDFPETDAGRARVKRRESLLGTKYRPPAEPEALAS